MQSAPQNRRSYLSGKDNLLDIYNLTSNHIEHEGYHGKLKCDKVSELTRFQV
jgi:hypothetical protein